MISMPGWYSVSLLLLLSWQGSSSLVPCHGLPAHHGFPKNSTTLSRTYFPCVSPEQNLFNQLGVSRLCYIPSSSLIWVIPPFRDVEKIPLSLELSEHVPKSRLGLHALPSTSTFFWLSNPAFICLKQYLQKTVSSSVYLMPFI